MRKIDRFDKYMKYRGLNDNMVTIQLGLSVGVLGKSRKENRDLSDRVVAQVLNFYTDINKVWLLTGEGEMLIDDVPSSATKVIHSAVSEPRLNYGKQNDDVVIMSREVFDQITKLTETVLSQQRTIEVLTLKVKPNTADTA